MAAVRQQKYVDSAETGAEGTEWKGNFRDFMLPVRGIIISRLERKVATLGGAERAEVEVPALEESVIVRKTKSPLSSHPLFAPPALYWPGSSFSRLTFSFSVPLAKCSWWKLLYVQSVAGALG